MAWNVPTSEELDALYEVSVPTPGRVIELLETDEKVKQDGKITTWLHRFVRNTYHLKTFLRFVTGAELLHSHSSIQVQFKDSNATKPLPSAFTWFPHTDSSEKFWELFSVRKKLQWSSTRQEAVVCGGSWTAWVALKVLNIISHGTVNQHYVNNSGISATLISSMKITVSGPTEGNRVL